MLMATKKRRAGHKVVFVETPLELADRLAAVAERNHRSVTGEAIIAFERHVKAEEARLRAEEAADEAARPDTRKRRGK
jgi:hypothetical protein